MSREERGPFVPHCSLCGTLDQVAAQAHGFGANSDGEKYMEMLLENSPHPGQQFSTSYVELNKKMVN